MRSRFPGSLPFISGAISMKHPGYYFFMPTDVPSFVEKCQKIKYMCMSFLTGLIGGNWSFVKHLFYY
jgi:hypothetical protein